MVYFNSSKGICTFKMPKATHSISLKPESMSDFIAIDNAINLDEGMISYICAILPLCRLFTGSFLGTSSPLTFV